MSVGKEQEWFPESKICKKKYRKSREENYYVHRRVYGE